jgi:pimeloyl-ACP methyl ester carboxylesterase
MARKVTLVSHSWGGAVAEYLVLNRATFVKRHGDTMLAFVVAADVPGAIAGAQFLEPTLRSGPRTEPVAQHRGPPVPRLVRHHDERAELQRRHWSVLVSAGIARARTMLRCPS